MKVKRITVLICILIMTFSLVLYFVFESCRNEFMLSFFSSGLISLLLELPSLIMLKTQKINTLFYTLEDIKTDLIVMRNDLNKMLEHNNTIITGIFNKRREKMSSYKEIITQNDKDLFLKQKNNHYLQNLIHNITLDHSLFEIAVEKMDLAINTLLLNKNQSGAPSIVLASEITFSIKDVIKVLEHNISTCDLYIDLIYNKKYKILWKLYEESINETILMNDLK